MSGGVTEGDGGRTGWRNTGGKELTHSHGWESE